MAAGTRPHQVFVTRALFALAFVFLVSLAQFCLQFRTGSYTRSAGSVIPVQASSAVPADLADTVWTTEMRVGQIIFNHDGSGTYFDTGYGNGGFSKGRWEWTGGNQLEWWQRQDPNDPYMPTLRYKKITFEFLDSGKTQLQFHVFISRTGEHVADPTFSLISRRVAQ